MHQCVAVDEIHVVAIKPDIIAEHERHKKIEINVVICALLHQRRGSVIVPCGYVNN